MFHFILHTLFFSQSLNAELSVIIQPPSAVIEISCSIFSSFYQCSDIFNKTDDVYHKYKKFCNDLSFGSRFIQSKCEKDTMRYIAKFLTRQPVPDGGEYFSISIYLKNNPRKVVNFVMNAMINNELYLTQERNIAKDLYKLETELGLYNGRLVRSGKTRLRHRGKSKKGELILELSCSVFSVARYCSHQLDQCGEKCSLLERICNNLSFGSRLLSLSCTKETVSDVAFLLQDSRPYSVPSPEDDDIDLFWRTILTENPEKFTSILMNRVLNSSQNHKVYNKEVDLEESMTGSAAAFFNNESSQTGSTISFNYDETMSQTQPLRSSGSDQYRISGWSLLYLLCFLLTHD